MNSKEILMVHLGGLGDVCLSESVFHSLRTQFGNGIVALGNKRFLNLFGGYFMRVEGVESRKWLYLFSEKLTGTVWSQIVFIGKDIHGILRTRWQRFSEKELIFIDMYPEAAFGMGTAKSSSGRLGHGTHIEDYQLGQLTQYGVTPLKRSIEPKTTSRVILYPETGFMKHKWDQEHFVTLYESLRKRGVDVIVQQSGGLTYKVERAVFYEDLADVRRFYTEGGIFVSNDSGMAHLAGACGLFTITIFTDFDPRIWHPRGRYLTFTQKEAPVAANDVEGRIVEVLNRSMPLSGR